MKNTFLFGLIVLCFALPVFGQSSFTPFHERNDFLLTSPGAMKYGLYGYENPATLSYIRQPDILFTWSDASAPWDEFNRWGLFFGFPHFGFGSVHEKTPVGRYADYCISIGTGNRTISSGLSYGWTITDNPNLDKTSTLTEGILIRPFPLVSIGGIYTEAINIKGWEAVGELAVRPFGNESVAAFAEYVFHRTPLLHDDMWSAGIAVEALPGVRITGRYFNTDAFSVGCQLSFGRTGIESQAHYDGKHHYSYNTYGIRLGAYDRNIFDTYFRQQHNFVAMDLHGDIDYQRYEWFDNTKTLSSLLEIIEAAKTDPSIQGIAINTSGMDADREKLWELREKLREFKRAGKKVIIYIDRGEIDLYHFASIADILYMDPLGILLLKGYVGGRTYIKGTLEKIGIGFDEWRFFKYKSANESFSRDKMSEGEREQLQCLIDSWYSSVQQEICESRHFSPEQFSKLINEETAFLAQHAKERGLVDSLGRWEQVKESIESSNKENSFISTESLEKFNRPYDGRWGEPPSIAVIYALGVCAMDEGITARSLVKNVESAVDNTNVKAIVLRVDSPGGDALASDIIAEALKKAKGKKPIIVSQGFVAASGGYWLSMYADTIVAAPGTITGSIGVIGGWFYDKGLKEKLGTTTDFVKAGEHADLGFGMRIPLIGLTIPDRNLTEMEHTRMESLIKTYYQEFVEKVSLGRKKNPEEIESIAQGRIWTGIDGKKKGLVDELGGLDKAINVAKERAGILPDQEVTIIEMPKKGFIDFSKFMPKLFGVQSTITKDPAVEILKFRLQHNGEPMPMLPLEEMDFMEIKE